MNHQRQQFQSKVAEHVKSGVSGGGEGKSSNDGSGSSSETRIEHNADGTHTVHHSDGETSGPHVTMAHAAMQMAAKHAGGEHGHVMPNPGGGATTHHVTMDGQVQGPMDHASEEEAYSHLRGSIGEGSMSEEGNANMGVSEDEDSSFA